MTIAHIDKFTGMPRLQGKSWCGEKGFFWKIDGLLTDNTIDRNMCQECVDAVIKALQKLKVTNEKL